MCRHDDYHAYWHGLKALLGRLAHVRKDLRDGARVQPPAVRHGGADRAGGARRPGHRVRVRAERREGLRREARVRNARWRTGPRGSTPRAASSSSAATSTSRARTWTCTPRSGSRPHRPAARGARAVRDAAGRPPIDTGRALDPDNANLFTWWAPWRNLRARNIGWRIDYVLASPGVAERATECIVQADYGTSDHAPVVLTLE